MRVRQYVCFMLSSATSTAAELSDRVGMIADRSTVRGSRVGGDQPIPRWHMWELCCDSAELPIDKQLARLVARLAPHVATISEIVRQLGMERPPCSATFSIVRHFDDPEGAKEVPRQVVTGGRGLATMTGQHQLLGWHLDRETLQFILGIGAAIDVDEYG